MAEQPKPRICDHCGSDSYFARQFPRVRDESLRWQQRAKKLAADVAALELDIEEAAAKDRTDVAWLQAKVVAQRRELTRLNNARNARLIKDDLEPEADKVVDSVTAVEVGR